MTGDGETAASDKRDAAGDDERPPVLDPRVKSSLLWGLVGGLSFLVLAQGYELVGGLAVRFGAKLAVAAVVTVGAATLSHVTRERLPPDDAS